MAPRSFAARLFIVLLTVSLAAFGLGGWWLRRAMHVELTRLVTVDRTTRPGEEHVNEVVRVLPGRGPMPALGDEPGGPALEATLNRRILIGLALVLAGTVAATALVARRLLVPLRELQRAAGRWSAGGLATRVAVTGGDEVADVARALNEMAGALEAQEQLKRDLTNDVAHELRTPLTNLRCHLEALQDGVVSATPDTLSTLLVEVKHLQRLVEDLGDLARADAGQLALQVAAVDLGDVVAHLQKELAPRLLAAALTLEVDLPPGLPALWADRERVLQVLRNLIDNAIAHTPAGGRIRLWAAPASGLLAIHVADSGSGMAPEHLPHIFDRFYRTDPSRSRVTGGAGLGLAIVRQLVVAHGGTIRAASEAGAGSTFTLEWPTARVKLEVGTQK